MTPEQKKEIEAKIAELELYLLEVAKNGEEQSLKEELSETRSAIDMKSIIEAIQMYKEQLKEDSGRNRLRRKLRADFD